MGVSKIKLLTIILICFILIFSTHAGDPDKAGGAALLAIAGGVIEAGLLIGGVYTLGKNSVYLIDKDLWEPSITTGYIYGISNIVVGAVIYAKDIGCRSQLGKEQFIIGVLGVGVTVFCDSKYNKNQLTYSPVFLLDSGKRPAIGMQFRLKIN